MDNERIILELSGYETGNLIGALMFVILSKDNLKGVPFDSVENLKIILMKIYEEVPEDSKFVIKEFIDNISQGSH